MQGVSQRIVQAATGPEDMILLARVVQALAPVPSDEITRKGLIWVALRRMDAPIKHQTPDCLSAAFERTMIASMARPTDLSGDLARVASLVFSAFAGDLTDPSEGAIFVTRHTAILACPQSLYPAALLGDFLFFKTTALI